MNKDIWKNNPILKLKYLEFFFTLKQLQFIAKKKISCLKS